jgi:hypothetical protein
MLNVIDEFTHGCLTIRVARKLKAIDVIDVLFILRGVNSNYNRALRRHGFASPSPNYTWTTQWDLITIIPCP